MKRWLPDDCPECGGSGLIQAWEPTDCHPCGGSGQVWISPKDRVADYPGGPFRGSYPGRYNKLARGPTLRDWEAYLHRWGETP